MPGAGHRRSNGPTAKGHRANLSGTRTEAEGGRVALDEGAEFRVAAAAHVKPVFEQEPAALDKALVQVEKRGARQRCHVRKLAIELRDPRVEVARGTTGRQEAAHRDPGARMDLREVGQQEPVGVDGSLHVVWRVVQVVDPHEGDNGPGVGMEPVAAEPVEDVDLRPLQVVRRDPSVDPGKRPFVAFDERIAEENYAFLAAPAAFETGTFPFEPGDAIGKVLRKIKHVGLPRAHMACWSRGSPAGESGDRRFGRRDEARSGHAAHQDGPGPHLRDNKRY